MTKIDFHSHYLTPGFVDYLDRAFDGHGDGVATPKWSVDSALEMMAKEQIDYSLLSISSPQISTPDKQETVELAQEVDEFGRDFHRNYPDKLGFMASLPMPYISESVTTVDTALDDDQATGFIMETNSLGMYLGDPEMDPIMDRLNKRHALVCIHPTEPKPINTTANAKTATPLMEFFFDTTRAVSNMAEHQIFSRYPNIQWIIPHAGALLPIIAQRISEGSKALGLEVPRDDLMTVLNHSYFDIAGMVLPYQLPTLLKIADPSKLLYGADFPYTPLPAVHMLAEKFEKTKLVAPALKQNILFNNGQKLLSQYGIQL
ncbi:amidohydrolase family protein [Secundilactobacillus folii]|uniref:6-methylsalicylate decarboxylase n=1 Tax=Secundilactobacillus folii TaxID=2678357 RepID=A0A7X3C2N9_9LACO|nr:amidohydrolase family protein [Secundilactobacillus folii]MTV82032.1 amidohydrolase family protein [Secundilactobacillus folii]